MRGIFVGVTEIHTKFIESPIGWLELQIQNGSLVRLNVLGSAPGSPGTGSGAGSGSGSEAGSGARVSARAEQLFLRVEQQLREYFQGARKKFDLPLQYAGTAFQQAVWGEIAKVKAGESTTYTEIAEAIGNPKAVRAVGGAVGANPLALVIGCHRVLGSGGKITGYSGGRGLATKRRLLELEQIDFSE